MLQELIKASQLGTSRYVPEVTAFPLPLQELYNEMKTVSPDNEDFFLKLSASVLLFMESGKKLPSMSEEIVPAPLEELPYLSATNAQHLRNFSRSQEDRPLLEYFLQKATERKQLAPPDLIPELLNMAEISAEPLRSQLATITGKRGQWLAALNPVWKELFVFAKEISEELWHTGTKEERKYFLAEIRKKDPARGLELLKETLPKENANVRVELLDVLCEKVLPEDEAFLESLLTDKSVKVRDTAYLLMRMIPTSRLIKLYQHWLQQGLEIKEERNITLQKKKNIRLRKFEITDEEVFKSGLEKVSSEKGKDDQTYWLEQLAAWVPPSWWADWLGESLEDTITLLRKEKETVFLAKAMISAAVLFDDKRAAQILAKAFPGVNVDILQLLDAAEAFELAKNYANNSLRQVVFQFIDRRDLLEWPAKGAHELLNVLEQQPYAINAQDYASVAIRLPKEMIQVLKDKIESTDSKRYEQVYFSGRCESMLGIMERKAQIVSSF